MREPIPDQARPDLISEPFWELADDARHTGLFMYRVPPLDFLELSNSLLRRVMKHELTMSEDAGGVIVFGVIAA